MNINSLRYSASPVRKWSTHWGLLQLVIGLAGIQTPGVVVRSFTFPTACIVIIMTAMWIHQESVGVLHRSKEERFHWYQFPLPITFCIHFIPFCLITPLECFQASNEPTWYAVSVTATKLSGSLDGSFTNKEPENIMIFVLCGYALVLNDYWEFLWNSSKFCHLL